MLQTGGQSRDVCALSESILPMFSFGQNSGHCVVPEKHNMLSLSLSAAAAKLRTAKKRFLFLCIARFFVFLFC
jgi:hypothetical protein